MMEDEDEDCWDYYPDPEEEMKRLVEWAKLLEEIRDICEKSKEL